MSLMKVLVSDKLGGKGVAILDQCPELQVDEKTGLSPKELQGLIAEYDGIIIRSATQLTPEILKNAKQLKVIGRAGVGVDNVDLETATKQGVIVMNTPEGNTVSTCELAFSLIMALSRHIPQAHQHVKNGHWKRNQFVGQELRGKTLGVIGFGRIGREVAKRALAFDMRAVISDPFIPKEMVEDIGAEFLTFEDLCSRSDYITVHLPFSEKTKYLLNKKTFDLMKPGVRVINCARGGIVNEEDLADAIRSGKVKGAALDVFEQEPPTGSPLLDFPEVIMTPHLGASTPEAQENVAIAVAEQVRDALLSRGIRNAVNLPSMDEKSSRVLGPWVTLAEKVGAFQSQLVSGSVKKISIRYSGDLTQYQTAPVTLAILKGFLTKALGSSVNYVNASLLAKDRGITVIESKTTDVEDFQSFISVVVENENSKNLIMGTLFGDNNPRIVKINDYYVEAIPTGEMLFLRNQDKPGVIGEVCVQLGNENINIAEMALGRLEAGGHAITIFNVDEPVSDGVLEKIRSIPNVLEVRSIQL